MTKGPPEQPPENDFRMPLTKRYPPHGFPPYLGLGRLDSESLKLEPGLSVAEYREGDDLVYRVTGKFSPDAVAEGGSACGVEVAEWMLEEFFNDDLWLSTDGYQTFPQVFYHHLAAQLPSENPRLRNLFVRLTLEYEVAHRIRHQTSHVMFPAGYVYVIRLPITQASLAGCQKFVDSVVKEEDAGVPPPNVSNPGSIAILKCNAKSDVEVERGDATEITVAAIRLLETLERIIDCGADAGPVHLRPEVMHFNERAWKHSTPYPGKIERDIVTYMVVPVCSGTPPVEELVQRFGEDSLELHQIVSEALEASQAAREE